MLIEQLETSQNEIEAKILSCILNNHFETEEIFLELAIPDFTIANNAKIFAVSQKLMLDGKNYTYFDVLDFFHQNKSNKEFYFPNYQKYIEEINDYYIFDASILGLIDIMKKNSVNKQLQIFGTKLNKLEMDVTNYNDKIYEIQTDFLEIINSRKIQIVKSIAEIMPSYYEKFKASAKDKGNLTGCPSGFLELDRVTHGFQKGDMIILAARPGVGKTALAINFMLNAAQEFETENDLKKNHKPKAVLFFSMEMGEEQICERMISAQSCVELSKLKRSTYSPDEAKKIENAITILSGFPILIDDSSNLSIVEIQSKIKQVLIKYDLGLVIIDYLQLLKGPQTRGIQTNRQQEVSNISKIIKHIARQYEIPIIAIAQLSRKIEERKGENKRPILSDLRESGSIEQDADIVSFISPKIAEKDKEANNTMDTVVEYIISKHRNGETGIIDFYFKKDIGKYILFKD